MDHFACLKNIFQDQKQNFNFLSIISARSEAKYLASLKIVVLQVISIILLIHRATVVIVDKVLHQLCKGIDFLLDIDLEGWE